MSGECLERDRKDRLVDLVDQVYSRLEKLGELIARDARASGRHFGFVKLVLLEEAYDRLAEARRIIADVEDCRRA